MIRKPTPLKTAIFQRGMLQADIAAEAHISEARLSRLVNGRAQLKEEEIRALARILGMPEQELAS